jgi:hypothetical protein
MYRAERIKNKSRPEVQLVTKEDLLIRTVDFTNKYSMLVFAMSDLAYLVVSHFKLNCPI